MVVAWKLSLLQRSTANRLRITNAEWIATSFGRPEALDLEEFASIDAYMAAGGMIFTAVEREAPLACCMVIPEEDGTGEIRKLGSNRAALHKGAGADVCRTCMEWAAAHGTRRTVNITGSMLGAAVHICGKLGFRELAMESYGCDRGDIAFEYLCRRKGRGECCAGRCTRRI